MKLCWFLLFIILLILISIHLILHKHSKVSNVLYLPLIAVRIIILNPTNSLSNIKKEGGIQLPFWSQTNPEIMLITILENTMQNIRICKIGIKLKSKAEILLTFIIGNRIRYLNLIKNDRNNGRLTIIPFSFLCYWKYSVLHILQ